ncbi:nuclear transport factor 2 family protein [Streptomyces sp. 8L]|uniref:nuclear transport factor 2 family protein n=1 Tax=Streptomyces sp. 8L TaxID=2877242 RepID=UPI001CD26B8A|nr:nuclear transport factor 2 family protein [Streptomyces sp. 8L]MCA1216944.1 nuclear transport factor 2 family protein [Streptomyces sp. 8L]
MDSIAQVRAREDAFFLAQTASDVAALNEIMSDRLKRFVHTTGLVETKAQYLEGVESGRHAHGAITRITGHTSASGGGAVTIGVVDMVAEPPGVPSFTMRIHHVLVWAHEDTGWRLTARQATRQPL